MSSFYLAGKTSRAEEFISLEAKWSHVQFTSRWPYVVAAGVPDDDDRAKVFWPNNLSDIDAAEATIVFPPDEGQHLRGAIVEAGYALAKGKAVYVIGDHADYGTWKHLRGVEQVESFEDIMIDYLIPFPDSTQ